jgi:Predicted membrane protein (DUF2079)
VLMPIVFMASLDGLRRIGRPALNRLYPWISVAVMVVVTLAAYPLPHLLQSGFYRPRSEVASTQRLIQHVPGGSAVRTDNNLAPLIVSRNDTTMLYADRANLPVEQWLLVDLGGCALNAPHRWTMDYLHALAPYTVHAWHDGKVELVQLRPGAPAELPDPYPPC